MSIIHKICFGFSVILFSLYILSSLLLFIRGCASEGYKFSFFIIILWGSNLVSLWLFLFLFAKAVKVETFAGQKKGKESQRKVLLLSIWLSLKD